MLKQSTFCGGAKCMVVLFTHLYVWQTINQRRGSSSRRSVCYVRRFCLRQSDLVQEAHTKALYYRFLLLQKDTNIPSYAAFQLSESTLRQSHKYNKGRAVRTHPLLAVITKWDN